MQIIPNLASSQNQMKQDALVVSIHDVSPLTQDRVDGMLHDLKKVGVTRCSLLVIPNHHQQALLSENSSFVEWLQEQEKKGHEVVLHGFYHRRPTRQKEHWITRWITQHYTMGEGEFYDLSKEEAQQKLKAGLRQLHQAGFDTAEIGFIAPAWLLSEEAEKALQEEGFLYTTRLQEVIHFLPDGTRKNYFSQSMVYSPRSVPRRAISLLWNELLFHYAKKWPLLRIGLHPPDWNYPAIRQHALSSTTRALKKRNAMTYREWVLK